jgi:sec-independent protein translocase protein TatA
MFGLSGTHLLVIGVVALLLFGNRLPEVARSLGRSFNEFKRGLRDVQDEFDSQEPAKGEPSRKLRSPGAPSDQIATGRSDAGAEPAHRDADRAD